MWLRRANRKLRAFYDPHVARYDESNETVIHKEVLHLSGICFGSWCRFVSCFGNGRG